MRIDKLSILIFIFFIYSATVFAQDPHRYTILFSRNSSELKGTGLDELELLLSNLDSITVNKIHIDGYSDYLGYKHYNQELSEDRANNTFTYLKNRLKIDRPYYNLDSLAIVEGHGELASVFTPPEGIPEHRKVDVTIYFKPIQYMFKENEDVLVFDPRKQLQSEQTYILKRVNFYPDTPQLLGQSIPVLNSFYKHLKDLDYDFTLIINGHICCLPKDAEQRQEEFGVTLSTARALRIKEYLIEKGLDRDKIEYEGFGFERPLIFPEIKPLDQLANRRVEVIIIKNE